MSRMSELHAEVVEMVEDCVSYDVITEFMVSAGYPREACRPIIDQIASDTRRVLADQTFVEKTLDIFGFDPISETPEQFAETVQRDVQAWRKIVVENNIRLE